MSWLALLPAALLAALLLFGLGVPVLLAAGIRGFPVAALAPASLADANLRRLSHQAIQQVIAATQGNMSEAARRLGISRNTLYRRLKQAPD